MNERLFRIALVILAAAFSVFFLFVVVPPLIANPDIWGALRAGFVNPYASGYSTDVIICWAILALWVVYEAREYGVRHGWICLLLGLIPGVAVGLALYLLIRSRQLVQQAGRA